jgi:malonyl-CoA/methylmalonyl-CoA synthetase
VPAHFPGWAPHLPPGVALKPGDLVRSGSLPARWAAQWAAAPDRPTLHAPGIGWLGAGELEARSARVAARLVDAGLRPGDRVLMSCAPSADLVVAHLACLRSGLVVVPANTAYRAEELAHIIADSEPRAAVVDDAERAGWCAQAGGPGLLVTEPAVPLPEGPTPPLDAAAVEADSPALIGYTSGTTGRPKGAVLSHGNLLASVEALVLAWRWTAADRLVLALPLFHMHGLGVGLHGTLAAGASAVLVPRFTVDAMLDAAAEHRATLFFGVPTMYTRLVDSPRAGELRRLRLCVSGSAPLPADLHERFEAASGQRVLERYGMTETVMLVSNPYDGERRPGTVGFPLPGVELRLSPERGEVLVRGPNVFAGYRNRPEATAEAFDGDGWFRTGDLGAFDADGYLRLVGRAKELIISGGYNVYPREVEDVLRLHPAVADAAVVGAPDAEWGEVVTAWVELRNGSRGDVGAPVTASATAEVTAGELIAFVGEHLAAYKRPRHVHFVGDLPRNALGKVQKHLL